MKLISNIEQIKNFWNTLTEGPKYVFIVARKKWNSELSSGEVPLGRYCVNSFDEFIQILQECENKQYDDRGILVPENSVCVYINPNIRSFSRTNETVFNSLVKYKNRLTHEDKLFAFWIGNFIFSENDAQNPFQFLKELSDIHGKEYFKKSKSELLTSFAVSKGERKFLDIDIDCIDKTNINRDLLNPILDFIKEVTGLSELNVVMTRSGCHVLLEPSKIGKNNSKWHLQLTNAKNSFEGFELDFQGGSDKLVPCPGTVQGGFEPYYLKV